jgi:hypothetical protein
MSLMRFAVYDGCFLSDAGSDFNVAYERPSNVDDVIQAWLTILRTLEIKPKRWMLAKYERGRSRIFGAKNALVF